MRATYLVQAGRLEAGLDTMKAWLGGRTEDSQDTADERVDGQEQLVALARELAMERGKEGISVLDSIEPLVTHRNARMQWYLARIDLLHQIQDLTAYQQEQQRLYRYMEGKDG